MLQIWIGALAGAGAFFIGADGLKIPPLRTSLASRSFARRQRKTGVLELLLKGISEWIASHMRLNEYRRVKLLSDLKTAGISRTPEAFLADATVKAGLVGLLAIPAFFLFPLIAPLLLVLAVAVYAKAVGGMEEKIKAKRAAIEYELPRLVFTVEKTLSHSRDVLATLDQYRENAGPVLKAELAATVADMRSGNYESALIRLEARVGSTMLSDVVRGLISILRGDETAGYWAVLSIKFSDIQRQTLRQEALKVPGKVNRLSMILLFCFMLTYLVVLLTQIVSSLGVLFG